MPDLAASIDALATTLAAEIQSVKDQRAQADAREAALNAALAKLGGLIVAPPKPVPAPSSKPSFTLPAWLKAMGGHWAQWVLIAVLCGVVTIDHRKDFPHIGCSKTDPAPPPQPKGPLRVILAQDTAAPMTAAQLAVLNSTTVRDYLNQHCGKDGNGRPAWRSWDKNVDASGESQDWRDAWAAAKPTLASLPMAIVFVGQKGTAFPLPDTEAGMLALLKRFEP